MLKGAQKRMYVVKMGQDSMFEEAYFVLKRESGTAERGDMVSEATKIIRQSASGQQNAAAKERGRWLPFLIGFLAGLVTGGGAAAAICLLL